MKNRSAIFFGLTLMACPVPALAQQAAPSPLPVIKTYGEIGGWLINSATLEGQHMVCMAVPPGEAAGKAAFELSTEGLTTLVATSTKGNEGDEVKGSYSIDGKSTSTPFYRRENNRNMGFIKEPHAKQMAADKGKVFVVTVGKEKLEIPLAGFGAAYKKVVECNDREGKPR